MLKCLNVFVKKDVVEDMSVIFVRDTGDDNLDGLSDINAVRTLRRAYELLLENNSGKDGTIVVVGPVLHSEVDDVLPHHDIVITITAIYNEANYQFNEGMLVLYQNMLLNGPTIFENINIKNGTTQTTRGIYAQGNDLVIGENVETIKSKLNYPSIMGGSPDGTLNKDVNIIIKSGYWRNFFGGSYRGVLNGNVTVKIYGGTFENMFYGGAYQLATSDKVLTSVYVSGDVEIEIFDGYFICGVYAGSNYGDIIGNTKITINGGIFEKGISPSSNRGIVSGNQSIIDNR